MAILVMGVALLAASLGAPFANASTTYCGDFCRHEIMLRAGAFVGWPLVTVNALTVAARLDDRRATPAAAECAAWSRAWRWPTLILGLLASAAWWAIILP